MDSCTIVDESELYLFFKKFRGNPQVDWLFRGQSNIDWQLIPKAGRIQYISVDNGMSSFNEWSKLAVAYYPNLPIDDWERLAIAQHHGLATCFLDWTFNPLVALYYACAENDLVDGAVYCFAPEHFVREGRRPSLEKLKFTGVVFAPNAITPRILNQKSVFTVHLPSNSSLLVKPHHKLNNQTNLTKLVIPSKLKLDILKMLNDFGINSVTLFPDLEGLSQFINWKTEFLIRSKNVH